VPVAYRGLNDRSRVAKALLVTKALTSMGRLTGIDGRRESLLRPNRPLCSRSRHRRSRAVSPLVKGSSFPAATRAKPQRL
jgi:hypothetical protein